MESLIAKFCSEVVKNNQNLSELEQKIFGQFRSHSPEYLEIKYSKVKKIINDTNNFDLDLKVSCLLIIEQFRR